MRDLRCPLFMRSGLVNTACLPLVTVLHVSQLRNSCGAPLVTVTVPSAVSTADPGQQEEHVVYMLSCVHHCAFSKHLLHSWPPGIYSSSQIHWCSQIQSLMRRPAMTHEKIWKLLSAKQCGHLCAMPTPTELFKKVGTCCSFKSLKYREAGITWNLRCLRLSSQMHVHIAPCPHSPNVMSPNYKMGRYLCQTSPPPRLNHTGAICQRILPNGANKTTHWRTVISLDVPKKVNKANDLSKSDYRLIP